MKIKKIIAHNFMSLKHVEVNLVNGLNTFIGSSDSGKTTLCSRALRWVIFNDFSGDYFVRDNDVNKVDKNGVLLKEEECYVTIETDNDIMITRKKLKSKNIYEVMDQNGEMFCFENFGNVIPEKITELLGTKKLIVDKDLVLNINMPNKKETNIIAANNGQKAKILGSFVGTNVLDSAIRSCQADIGNNSTKRNIVEKDKELLEEKLKKFDNLEKKEKLLETLEKLYENLSSLQKKNNDISLLKSNIDAKINDNKELDKIIVFKQFNEEKNKRLKELEQLVNTLKFNNLNVRNILLSLNNLKSKIKLVDEDNKIIENKEVLIKKVKSLNSLENKISSLKDDYVKVSTTLSNIKQINVDIKNYVKTINSLEELIQNKSSLVKKEKKIKDCEKRLTQLNNSLSLKQEEKNKLNVLITSLRTNEDKELKGTPILKKMKESLNELILEYVDNIKVLGKCPLCNSNLDETHLQEIKEELLIKIEQ